jgi:putative membrane protein
MAHPLAAGAAAPLDLAAAAAGWSARPEVAAPLLILVGAYVAGWWRLRRRGARLPAGRGVATAAGVTSLALALLSPLDAVAETSFAGHMVQHLLLIAVAAPALLLADPFPALVWALPSAVRARAGRMLRPGGAPRRLGAALTVLPVAWLVHVGVLWLWHAPVAYDAAVADRLVHDLEHVAFFGSALLFWWPLLRPAPRLRPPAPLAARVVALVLAALQGALLGLLLALSPEAWYASYAHTTWYWGLTPIEDQALGGLIMWGLGGGIDMLAVLLLTRRFLAAEDRMAPGQEASGAWVSRGVSRRYQ